MRTAVALPTLLWLLGICSSATGLQARAANTTELQRLPQCATRCLSSVLPSFDCQVDASCFCDNDDLSKSFSSCINSGCATLEDRLTTQRSYAETCNKPVRSRITLTRGVVWALLGLAGLFFASRILSRWTLLNGRGYSWDDFVVLLCFAMLVPLSISLEFEVQNGLGQDAYRSNIDQISEILHWYYFGELLYVAIVILTKVAVVLLYLRIWTIESIKPAFRVVCWATIAVLVATFLAFDFALVFRCSPINFAWNKVKGSDAGRCVDINPLMYTFGALNILYDILVFVMPIQSVWALALSWKNKIGVSSIFLVGLAVTASAAVRLQYQIRIDDTNNITWNLQYVAMWSFIEAALSIVCTCMPAIVGLAQRIVNGEMRETDEFMTMDSSSGPRRQNIHRDKSFYDRNSLGSAPLGTRDGMVDNEKALSQLDEEDESPYESQTTAYESPPASFGEISIMRDEPENNNTSVSTALPEQSWVRSRHLKNQAQPLSALHYRSRVSGSPKRVQISHDPPSKPSEAKMTYRDEDDILHEVTITDIPQERPPGPFHSNWRNGATRPRALRAITEAESNRNSRLSGGDMTGPRPTGENIFAAFRALSPVSLQSQMASPQTDAAESTRNASSSPSATGGSSGYVSAQDLHRPPYRSRSASTQTAEDAGPTSPSISRGRSPGDAARVPPPVLVRNSSSTQTADDLRRAPLSPSSQSGSTQTETVPRNTSRSGSTQTDNVPRKSSRSGSTQTDIVPRKTSRSGSTQTDILPGLLASPRSASRSGSTQTDELPGLGSIVTVRRGSRGMSTQTDEVPSLPTSPMSPTSVFTTPQSSNDALPPPVVRMGMAGVVGNTIMVRRPTGVPTDESLSSLPTTPMSPTSLFTAPESSNDSLPHPVVRTVPSNIGSIISAREVPRGLAIQTDGGLPFPVSPISPMSPSEVFTSPESSNDALPPPVARTSWS